MSVRKFYLDTEFYENGTTIDLISIGIVCEDGREFYAVNQDAKLHLVSPWLRENVLPSLPSYNSLLWQSREAIRNGLLDFVRLPLTTAKPQFWGYFSDYDWVVLCQLFGTMMDLPRDFPKYCMDLKQLAVHKGNPELPKQTKGKHNALEDARWNKEAHSFLEGCLYRTE